MALDEGAPLIQHVLPTFCMGNDFPDHLKAAGLSLTVRRWYSRVIGNNLYGSLWGRGSKQLEINVVSAVGLQTLLGTAKAAERVWVRPLNVLMVFNTVTHDKATS